MPWSSSPRFRPRAVRSKVLFQAVIAKLRRRDRVKVLDFYVEDGMQQQGRPGGHQHAQ
jgi:hypothetical protein